MALINLNDCFQCLKHTKLYAKGLCSPCYQKKARLANPEKFRQRDRDRWKTPRRQEQDKLRHLKHKKKRNQLCREYRNANLERLREYDRIRWITDPTRKLQLQRYRVENRERVRETDRREYYRNKQAHIARVVNRKLTMEQAMPKWLTNKHREEITEIYKNRPEGYHVDHIIPLKGENVCGLHVPWNLQYLTASDNLRKSNKC